MKGKILETMRIRNKYDDELSLKTNLHLFQEDWKKLIELIMEVKTSYPKWTGEHTADELFKLITKKDAWFLENFGE